MDFLWDAITQWMKEILVSGIMSNLSGMFDGVNEKIGGIAAQVGTTPQAWNTSIFNMVQSLSENVVLPVAGVILAFVMTLELVQILMDKNNFHDIETDSRRINDNFRTGIYTREQLLPTLLYAGRFFEYGVQPHMVTKLFKKELLQKTQMRVDDRIVIGEDAAVVYPSVLEAERIAVSDICAYHYVQHPDSMTKRELKNKTDIFDLLLTHLMHVFQEKGVWSIMEPQLRQYRKYLLFMNQTALFDKDILIPYGGIQPGSKVIIYGAGVLGQKIHRYLMQQREINIVLWVDQKYETYRETGLEVCSPEEIEKAEEYDFILIANTVQSTAESIRQYLINKGIDNRKILWFSEEFRKA